MLTEIKKKQEKTLSVLLMKFNMSPSKALVVSQQWINDHPQESWESLQASLKNGLIKIEKEQLIDLYSPETRKLVNDMRGENGLEIKNRNYHFKTYPRCFIGSDAIKWLIRTYEITKSEALKLGQNLIDQRIIHHVVDDHDFKDDYLFYRFYIDE